MSHLSVAINGQNYTIDGLTINRSTTYTAMFGYTYGATISNLRITNVNITGSQYVSGMVGYNRSSTISNSYCRCLIFPITFT